MERLFEKTTKVTFFETKAVECVINSLYALNVQNFLMFYSSFFSFYIAGRDRIDRQTGYSCQ